jgi:ankyrin repeat protein
MTNPQAEMRQQLMNALYKDNFTTVDELLNKGVNINLPYNHSGWTPFMWVCKEHCDPDIIEKFLQYNPKINLKNKEGLTALHIMARYRSSFDCLALLIKKGANVDAQDNDGWTPLMDAVKHPQAMMRKDLIRGLAENSDTSVKNNEGKTAYDIAKENEAFNDDTLLLFLKPVDDLTEDEFHKIFSTYMGGNNE